MIVGFERLEFAKATPLAVKVAVKVSGARVPLAQPALRT
jgi:hypothetical protein